MDQLETIRLLTGEASVQAVLESLHGVVHRIGAEAGCKAITVHTCRTYPSDVLVCLRWSRTALPDKSCVGLALAEFLSAFGLVEHTVWPPAAPRRRR